MKTSYTDRQNQTQSPLVGVRGIEPPRDFSHQILNLTRLPFRHTPVQQVSGKHLYIRLLVKLLLVEDSPSDREILRHLLDAQFRGMADFYEAVTLTKAIEILEFQAIDCVILDLQLPDSIGRETFQKLNNRFPDVPIIVMTHSKDRKLALEMIQEGAADFVIKDYTSLNEEDLFRRIVFAIEKHRRTVRVPPESASFYHRLERAKSNLQEAQDQDQEDPSTVRHMTAEVTSAMADLSSKMFTELQKINIRLAQDGVQQEVIVQTVMALDKEVLRGHSDRPSMRSQVDLLDHRLTAMEEQPISEKNGEDEVTEHRMSQRTKIILAFISLLGVLGTATATAVATYFASTQKSAVPLKVNHEIRVPPP